LGAFDLSVVALARAGLISSLEVSSTKDEKCLQELKGAGAFVEDKNMVALDRIITSNDKNSGKAFGEEIIKLLDR